MNTTQAAQESQGCADDILAALREPFVVLDHNLEVRMANAAFYRDFQVAQEETETCSLFALGDGQWDIPRLRELLDAVRENLRVVEPVQAEVVLPNIGKRTVRLHACPIVSLVIDSSLILLAIEDVTERAQMEATLRLDEAACKRSEVQYRRLFQTARDGILILDQPTGRIIDANPFMSELLGYEHAYFMEKELWQIGLFKDIAANQAAFKELQATGYIRYDHLPLETRDKRKVDVEVVSNSYEAAGQLVIQCNIRDCTERFRLEQAVRASLEEKEVLLREVHHRVKNNLQVISSLLYLQSQHTPDSASVQMFRESQNRVRSMALVHERLYRSKDLAHVNFAEYIESLATHLFSSHQIDTDRIGLTVDVKGVNLSIDTAIPCGLLLNELISNCLKHAFVGKERGTIRVALRALGGGEILLSVSDDGIGLPSGVAPRTSETFGMQLMADLVEQLHGSVQIRRDSGTSIEVVFPGNEEPSPA